MTLILSCLTEKYALQISDRRLTLPDGSVYDDNSNKAILVNGYAIFGYTGLAYVDNMKTKSDEWFLEILGEAYKANPNGSFTTMAKYVARHATTLINNLNISPKLSRLAFVGIGWLKPPGYNDLSPVYTVISNTHDDNGRWLFEARSEFSVLHFGPSDDMPVMLVSDGQQLDRKTESEATLLIEKCLKKDISPNGIARILIKTARNYASTNPMVGKSLLVNSIPKASVRIGQLKCIGSAPRKDITTFAYLPENTSKKIQYGPHAFAYGVSIKDFFVEQKG